MTERTVTTPDGVRLHARADGHNDGPVLLLLNSLGTDLSLWEPQLGAWGASRQVLRFDLRGQGRSGVPPAPYTVEQLGHDAVAVLDAYGVGRADLCGISLGGVVALEVAAARPERVRRLVLADTAARVGSEQAWRDRAALVRAGGMGAVTDLVLERFFSRDFRARGSAALEAVRRGLEAAAVEGYAGACEALATADLHDLAPQVRAPTLVLVGSRDAATPPSDAEALAALVPDARLVELPGAGHLANLEEPALFARLVEDFLTPAEARGSDA